MTKNGDFYLFSTDGELGGLWIKVRRTVSRVYNQNKWFDPFFWGMLLIKLGVYIIWETLIINFPRVILVILNMFHMVNNINSWNQIFIALLKYQSEYVKTNN